MSLMIDELNENTSMPKLNSMSAKDYVYLFKCAQALLHAGLCSAGEISKLVAEMHATIIETSFPFLSDSNDTRPLHQKAPLPYRIVTSSLVSAAKLLRNMPINEIDSQDGNWLRFRAGLNGVAGDKLAYWNNALSIPMMFTDEYGKTLELEDINNHQSDGVVVFIHGLLCSELDWQTDEHRKMVAMLREQNKQVVWVRYNSGLHIHQNGERLAEMLQFLDLDKKDITLIGHSMGGLLMRSAYVIAQTHKYEWLNKLTHAAYIGTPHHGSQFERSGNYLNAFVGAIPFLKPFMRLGNIRSNAIKDLRYGYIIKENSAKGIGTHGDTRKGTPSLPNFCKKGTKHLLVASSLNDTTRKNFIGDGLVPVHSALGEHETNTQLTIVAENLKKIHIKSLGHIAQFSDHRIYDALRIFMNS